MCYLYSIDSPIDFEPKALHEYIEMLITENNLAIIDQEFSDNDNDFTYTIYIDDEEFDTPPENVYKFGIITIDSNTVSINLEDMYSDRKEEIINNLVFDLDAYFNK